MKIKHINNLLKTIILFVISVCSYSAIAQNTLSSIPSGTSTGYIPVATAPSGSQVGVSATISSSGSNPSVSGGGVAISAPITTGSSVGVGVSSGPNGPTYGAGATIRY